MKTDILNKPLIKSIISIYVIAITAFISYLTSKVFYEILWPNERVTVVIFMTISMLLPYAYMMLLKMDQFKIIAIYHLLLIFSALIMCMPYEFRPILLVVFLVAALTNFKVGVVANTAICGFSFFSMAADPEFFFTVIMLITGTIACFIAEDKGFIKKLKVCAAVFITSFVMHLVFRGYCQDSYPEYDTIGFVFKTQIGVIISILAYIGISYFYNIYFAKKASKRILKSMMKDGYRPLEIIKKKSTPVYLHSVEVANMSLKAAKKIAANGELAYIGALFHDAGKAFNPSEYMKESVKFAKKNNFPKEVIEIILTHNIKVDKPKTKEAAIVMLADTSVSAIEYMKTKGNNISEKDIISNVVMNRLSSGYLNQSQLSAKDLFMIKEAFVEGKE